MIEITIDDDLCKKDGLCVMTCTYGIFQQEEKGTIPTINEVMREKCFRCGQCVAICPSGAISMDRKTMWVSYDPEKCIVCELCVGTCPAKAMQVVIK